MIERRHQMRLQKSLECAITIDRHEYPATILDISQEGIAFTIERNPAVHEGDLVVISMADNYADGKTFLVDMIGNIKNITDYEGGKIRCGCYINDRKYSKYVQEQLIMGVCAPNR